MIDSLYSDKLLDAAGRIPPRRRLVDADATSRKVSRVCGSEVGVDLSVRDGVIADIALDVKACALGQASSSLFANAIIGATPAEVREAVKAVRAMLKEEGAPPAGDRWAELATLAPIRDYPVRHASTLLVFDAVEECLDRIAAGQGPA